MSRRLWTVLPTLLDVVIPIAGYYLLRAAGLDDFWALTASGLVTAVYAVVRTVRRGRLDSLGALVVIEIALSVALLFATNDPRVLLLKPSFFTGVGALYLLWTCVIGRPLTAETSRPFVTRGEPEIERALDRAWESDPGFRREHVRVTVVWAALFLAEAFVRVGVVLHTDVATGIWAGQVPGTVAFVLGVAFSSSRGPTLRRYAEAHRETVPVPSAS